MTPRNNRPHDPGGTIKDMILGNNGRNNYRMRVNILNRTNGKQTIHNVSKHLLDNYAIDYTIMLDNYAIIHYLL